MLMEDAVGLAPDGWAAAKHEDVEAEDVFFAGAEQDGGGLYACAVGVEAAALVNTLAVAAHDAHGAAGESPEASLHSLPDGVQHSAGDGAVRSHLKQEVGNPGVVAEGTAVGLRGLRVLQDGLQDPFGLGIVLRRDGAAVGVLFVLPEGGSGGDQGLAHQGGDLFTETVGIISVVIIDIIFTDVIFSVFFTAGLIHRCSSRGRLR